MIEKAQAFHASNPRLIAIEKLKEKTKSVETSLDVMAEHLSQLPKGISPEPLFRRMQKLEEEKNALHSQLTNIRSSSSNIELPASFVDYKRFCRGLKERISAQPSSELKHKIISRLIKKVEIHPNSFVLHYYVGAHAAENNFEKTKGKQTDKPSESFDSEGSNFSLVVGSKRLTNGGGGGN